MRVEQYDDPAAFREAVADHLLADEARHNLLIGLLGVLVGQPEMYPDFRLWRVADDGGATAMVALQTLPKPAIVSSATAPEAIPPLAAALAEGDGPMPGISGTRPEVDRVAELVAAARGATPRTSMAQAIHVLETVEDVPHPPGSPRTGGPGDLDLAMAWYRAFHDESVPDDEWDEELIRRRLTNRLAGKGGEAIWLWEDGGPVCLAGCIGATPSGMRIGPVYTPPEHRRRGYATGLVAHISRDLLASGRRFCFLYTDLANPTSNAIYRRIGYRRLCDAAEIRFTPPAPAPLP